MDAGGGTLLLPLAIETGDVAALAAAGQTTGLVQEPKLHGLVAVALRGFHLEDMTRPGLEHRNGDYVSCAGVENLRHPDLAAE